MPTIKMVDLARLSALASAMRDHGGDFALRTIDDKWVAVIPDLAVVSLAKTEFDGPTLSDKPLGIHVGNLAKLVKSLPAKSQPEVSIEDDMLMLQAGGKKRGMALLDPMHVASAKVPEVEMPVSAQVPISDILEAIVAAEGAASMVRISMGDGRVIITSRTDSSEVRTALTHDEIPAEVQGGIASSLYSCDILRIILTPYKGEVGIMRLDTDYPIRFDIGNDVLFAAPRIDT